MAFYGLIILVTTLFAYLYAHIKKSQKKLIFWVMVLIPTFFEGLRGVGTDYFGYSVRFFQVASETYKDSGDYSLIYTLMKLVVKIGGSYQQVIFIITFITIFIAFYILTLYKEYISIPVAVFSYMTMFYQMSFNTFRQILAAEVFLLAVTFLYKTKKNKLAFWLLFAIAVLIHSATTLFGLIYFLNKYLCEEKYISRRVFIYVAGIGIVYSLPIIAHQLLDLSERFPHYAYYFLNFEYLPIGFGLLRYLLLAVLPVSFLAYRQQRGGNIPADIQYCFFFAICGTIIWMTSYVSTTFIYRAGYTLLVALPILHGYLIKAIPKELRFFICFVLVVILVFFWWYDYGYLNSGETVPYSLFVF